MYILYIYIVYTKQSNSSFSAVIMSSILFKLIGTPSLIKQYSNSSIVLVGLILLVVCGQKSNMLYLLCSLFNASITV